MNLEKILSGLLKQKLSCEFRNSGSWKNNSKFRSSLKMVYEKSDLTTGELAEFFEISESLIFRLIAEDLPVRARTVWQQNFDQGLPLFVPVKLTGI